MTHTAALSESLFVPVRQKKRAKGALICGVFGTVWMLEALFFGRAITPATLVSVAALAILLIAWPLGLVYSLRDVECSVVMASMARAFWSSVVMEWTLCIIAANWLSRVHRYELIPQALGIIIGLHFVPLGKIFHAPIYYVTAAVMVMGSLAVSTIPAGPVHSLVAYGVVGMSLWGTSAAILARKV
jgi:hypothetical protein